MAAVLTWSPKSVKARAESAREGKEAMENYLRAQEEGSPYDAVILDLTVPGGMGGKETMQELLRIDPRVRPIVSSGFSNDPIISGFREYGFCGVLLKPYYDTRRAVHAGLWRRFPFHIRSRTASTSAAKFLRVWRSMMP